MAHLKMHNNNNNKRHNQEGSSKAATVNKDVIRMDYTSVCQFCMEAPRTVKCMPCGHDSLCRGCYDMIMSKDKKCILCRCVCVCV
jgi:hypothetical protein